MPAGGPLVPAEAHPRCRGRAQPPGRDLVGPPFPHQPTDRTTAGHPGSGPGEPTGRHIVGSFPGLSEPKVSMRTCRRKSSRLARDASPPRPSPTCPCSIPDCRTTSVPRWLRRTATCCCRGGPHGGRGRGAGPGFCYAAAVGGRRGRRSGGGRPVASGSVRCSPHIGHVAHAVIEHAASPVAVVAHDWPAAAQPEPPWTDPSRAVAV